MTHVTPPKSRSTIVEARVISRIEREVETHTINTRKTRALLAMLIALMTVGCATSQEGVSFGEHELGVEEIIEQRESRSDEALGEVPVDLILIGKVSAFRPLSSKNTEEIYAEYVDFASRLNPGRPVSLSAEEFGREIAGWTKLKTFSVPMIVSNYEFALVPIGLHEKIYYPSGFGTVMVQDSGDLVAARINVDGYFLVDKILCKEQSDYSACADNYYKGLFNGATGEELDYKTLTPEDSGKQIDPASYLGISAPP